MTYRPLGDSGLMVSAVGVGCNAFGRRVDMDGVRGILAAARDVGVPLLQCGSGGDRALSPAAVPIFPAQKSGLSSSTGTYT